MPKFYHVLALNFLCLLVLFGVFAYLLEGYPVLLLTPMIAYYSTKKTRDNLQKSRETHDRIATLIGQYAELSLFEEFNKLSAELHKEQQAVIITMSGTHKLLKHFQELERKAIEVCQNIRQTEDAARKRYKEEQAQASERAKHSRHNVEILPIPILQTAVESILGNRALKQPFFLFAPQQKKKDIIENLCKIYANNIGIPETTLSNLVLGRLATQGLKKAA